MQDLLIQPPETEFISERIYSADPELRGKIEAHVYRTLGDLEDMAKRGEVSKSTVTDQYMLSHDQVLGLLNGMAEKAVVETVLRRGD